jgi:hypothetical protein
MSLMLCKSESARPTDLFYFFADCGNGADDSYNDMLESELSGEVENGRLVRLMIKLGFINERAE